MGALSLTAAVVIQKQQQREVKNDENMGVDGLHVAGWRYPIGDAVDFKFQRCRKLSVIPGSVQK